MSQIARHFPDQPERWYPFGDPFSGMPKAQTTEEVFKQLGHGDKTLRASVDEAAAAMREASTMIETLRAENAALRAKIAALKEESK